MHVAPGGRSIYKKSQTGLSKSGPITKVVRLSEWSHSKVPLYRGRQQKQCQILRGNFLY